MENFFRIRAEKQSHIVNAAFAVFGRQGYRKASLGDIARAAGITKGMITYYFGSKKSLFLYLTDVCHSLLIQSTQKRMENKNADFFERMRISTEVSVSAIKEHPALISFINNLFNERDPEVAEEISQRLSDNDYPQEEFFMEGVTVSGFKTETEIMCKFMVWAADGFMMELYEDSKTDTDNLANKFYDCLELMQKTFTNQPKGMCEV
jgi:AcrR family transcriptional regulator